MPVDVVHRAASPQAAGRGRRAALLAVGAAVFAFTWLFRFNDPNGSFNGLTDDHFFYVVRGWQILFGDLPVRDFVDHGAPLYYYTAAAVQMLLGRGTLSELTFSVTMIAAGAALTFWLAARGSGSIALGLGGAVLQILLDPRFYNYPKILAYAAAIPLLWRFVDSPSSRNAFWLALVTAVSFLFRHDHGVYIALAVAVLCVAFVAVPVLVRVRLLATYGLLTAVLLAPYLAFVEMNGGVRAYLEQGSAWAARDRSRAPVVWPGLLDNPEGISDAAALGPWSPAGAVAIIRDNYVAWIYYIEIALPFLALALVVLSRDGFRPSWPHARAKIAIVAILAAVLDAGFLRGPLEARLADPSVPLAILVAWLAMAAWQLAVGRQTLRPAAMRFAAPMRVAAPALVILVLCVLSVAATREWHDRLDAASMAERPGRAVERVGELSAQLRAGWQIETWAARPDRSELIDLSLYLNACTRPEDRVLVQAYIPQVLALAQRGFAGGHADLRPGFFATEDAQRLTVSRLEQQSVPVMLLEGDATFAGFREGFPIVSAYVDRHYEVAATRTIDERFPTVLLVRRDRMPTGTYAPLGWPCFAPPPADPA